MFLFYTTCLLIMIQVQFNYMFRMFIPPPLTCFPFYLIYAILQMTNLRYSAMTSNGLCQ